MRRGFNERPGGVCVTVPLLNVIRGISSLYLGKYRTFVCATLFPEIKLLVSFTCIRNIPGKKLHIRKYDGL
jgi:hypothetical protein